MVVVSRIGAGVDFKTSTVVKDVDVKGKKLTTEGGDTIEFTKLVLATGCGVRPLPLLLSAPSKQYIEFAGEVCLAHRGGDVLHPAPFWGCNAGARLGCTCAIHPMELLRRALRHHVHTMPRGNQRVWFGIGSGWSSNGLRGCFAHSE